jgi:hypothetical protein
MQMQQQQVCRIFTTLKAEDHLKEEEEILILLVTM